MKADIHPEYVEGQVTCSCGNTFTTRSTVERLHVELCNECHPFFTGKQKLVDSGGRVERFQKRYGRTKFTRDEQEKAAADQAVEAPPSDSGSDTDSASEEAASVEA